MKRAFGAAVAALILTGSAAAQAQSPQPLKVSAKAAFKHRHSKLQLPPTLAGLQRSRVVEMEADQLDVAADYGSVDQGEVYTLYLFRNVAGGVPVWFDRARWMIEHRDVYGSAVLRGADPAFVPPGQSASTGLAASYDLDGKNFRSTAVAIVPLGEWLVKVRASSKTLSATDLDARMKAALAELRWPSSVPAGPAAAAVVPCTTGLSLSGDAKAVRDEDSGASALIGALLGSAMAETVATETVTPATAPRWCRDSITLENAGVYRADEQTDGYLIAFGDAGRAARVGPSVGLQLFQPEEEEGKGKRRWSVEVVLLPRTLTSGSYDRLPPPAQALKIANEGPFASSAPTWGKGKREIELNLDALK